MPFGLGMPELLLIFGIGALLFGGPKIAALGKGVGEGIRNFKNGLKDEKEGKE